jgi:ABC-type nitrate/sulfonate/bicarbonate transport system permease component
VPVRIGYLSRNSRKLQQVDDRSVGIVVTGLLGLIASALFTEIERLVIPRQAD